MVDAQQWLDQNKKKEKRIKIINLDLNKEIIKEKLEGKLNLSDFINLKTLDCSNQPLEKLDLSQNINLEKINCSNNFLKELDLSQNINLKSLTCRDNNQLTKIIGLENLAKLTSVKSDPFSFVNQLGSELKEWKSQFPSSTPQQLKTDVDQAKVFLNEFNILMGKERDVHKRITQAVDVFSETERNDNQRQMQQYEAKIVQVTTLRSKL